MITEYHCGHTRKYKISCQQTAMISKRCHKKIIQKAMEGFDRDCSRCQAEKDDGLGNSDVGFETVFADSFGKAEKVLAKIVNVDYRDVHSH
jgi:hypothetical protein